MISGQGGWVVGLALLLLTGRVFPAGTDWLSKIDALVRQAATQGETEVLVVLAEKADVRGAASLGRKQDKGAHVFQCLSTTAERSQAELRQFLESGGHAYRPFWIVNMIWVRGDAELIESLARRRP